MLVMPPQAGLLKGFSTGLISIANFVKESMPYVKVKIVDLSQTPWKGLRKKIETFIDRKPGKVFVGITTTTASYQSALETARVFKQALPDCVTIMGGHHVSADFETVLRYHPLEVDFIIVGEGEISTVELLKNFPEIDSVPGLAYMRGDKIIHNCPPPLLERRILDTLPMTFQGNGLHSSPGKFGHVTYVSARGCPLHCSFCSVANQAMRTRSADKVKEDIRTLVKIGFTKIAIEDNFFVHSFTRTTELCEKLKELRKEIGDVFSWDCQTRVESMMRNNIVPLMESAGCEAVYIGVESLNEDTLLFLGKTNRPKRYLTQLLDTVIPRILDSKIECYLNLQFGLPYQNSDDDEETYKLLSKIGDLASAKNKKITIFPQLFVVYPETKHFKDGIEQGIFSPDVFESFTEWEMKEEPIRKWLGEYFAHGVGGLPIGILDLKKLPRGEYSVIPDTVIGISATIRRIENIPGIQVFHYGRFLTRENIESPKHNPIRMRIKQPMETR